MKLIINVKFHFLILLFIIFSNLFLGWSFQILSISFIPILYILMFFLFLNTKILETLKILNKLKILKIVSAYLLYNFIKLLIDVNKFGIFAFRDATFVLDIMFFILTVPLLIVDSKYFERILIFFKYCSYYCVIFIIFWFFKEKLQNLTPYITSISGAESNLFFNFSTISTTCMLIAFFSYFFNENKNYKFFVFLFFLFFSIALSPKRMIYLWLICSLIFLIFINKDNISLFIKLFLIVILIQFLSIIGFNLPHPYLDELSFLQFLKLHTLSTIPFFNFENEYQFFENTKSTIDWRLDAWSSTLENVNKNYSSIIFGLPFGSSLTNFVNIDGLITREPHNLYLTTYARNGLLGSFLTVLLHYKIIRVVYLSFIITKKKKLTKYNSFILFIIIYLIFIYVGGGIAASILSVTYFSSLFYIFAGFVFSIYYNISMQNSDHKL